MMHGPINIRFEKSLLRRRCKRVYISLGMKLKSLQETIAFLREPLLLFREIVFKIEIFMVSTKVRFLPGHNEMRISWLSVAVLP